MLLVFDDFLDDPWTVRRRALNMSFNVTGHFPGARTLADPDPRLPQRMGAALQRPIPNWPLDGSNAAYQLVPRGATTWVHADDASTVSGVLFLSPDAPTNTGTTFFRHKGTDRRRYPRASAHEDPWNHDAGDPAAWEVIDVVGNVFNRLILFDGRLFHAASGYFGTDLRTARLTQTFFFDVPA